MTFFHYVHKNTVLHAMDGRVKVLCMVLMSLATSLAVSVFDYTILTCVVLTALLVSRLPLASLLRDMKFFLFLILFVFIMNSINTKGEPIPNFPIQSVSIEGVISGLMFAWRFTLIITICTIITGTTSLLVFKKVIEWYLAPIPFISETSVAMMVNLTFVLIPVILDQYTEMSAAQKARCVESRKNPVQRVLLIALPLLSNIFRKTDELVFAMEARCYSEERTKAVFKANPIDWMLLSICILTITLVIFL